MSEPVTLLDNGESRIVLRARQPRAAALVVTFNCSHSNDVEQPGWGEDFLWEEGFDVLSVKARSNSWYQDLSLEDVRRLMKGLPYAETFTYGTSMGAYAAAYFASVIKPRRALLWSPQYSIDPTVSAWDERWKDYWSIPFRHGRMEGPDRPGTEYVIFYDPWTLDGRHAEAIADAVGQDNVRRVRIPLSGHEAITAIYDAGVLSSLVLALLRDSPDLPGLISALARRRKQTWTYAYHLFFRALGQSRRIADKAFAAEILRRADRPVHRILSLEPFLALRDWEQAARLMIDVRGVRPGESLWIDGGMTSVEAALRGLDAGPGSQALLLEVWRQLAARQDPPAPPIEQPARASEPAPDMAEVGLVPRLRGAIRRRVKSAAARLSR